jgi:glucose/arabinose dehydrogenase
MTLSRRTVPLALAALAALAAPARSQAIQATLVQSGFSSPVFLTAPPGDLLRLFVVEQGGKIRIVAGGGILPAPFLDLGVGGLDKIVSGGESGLLGLAFHPNYASNGLFYVDYTAKGTGATVIERYQVSANPDVAAPASGFPLLSIAQPQSNHNGGCIQFGGDGKLYIAMGDGGGANDTGTGHAPEGNSQSPTTLLGKMLRLDVDLPAPYVPQDNPYVGPGAPLDEIWHFGLRNPWRFSFDRQTGELYIGDVGQGSLEEVSYAAAGAGGLNYGWRCMEGNNCTGLSGCTCNTPALTNPIQQYSHSGGHCAVTGGYVYRGANACGLQGTYFYADYCSSAIWSFRYVNGQVTQHTTRTVELEPAGAPTIDFVSGFGEDGAGELYVVDHSGEIYRIDPAGGAVDCNGNGVVDACDIQNGTEADCNANWIPDSCEIAGGTVPDCNLNAVPDSCDLASGTSLDTNGNAIPDECECQGGAPPFTYCTAKLNSQFCFPAIDFSGVPSLSAPAPFVIRATSLLNNRNGLLFYGYGAASAPFQGGTMCVRPPVRRTPVQFTGGSPAGVDCSGTLSFDFTAWMLAGHDPLLSVVGQQINAQYWSRDPQDPWLASTTDAVQAQVCQ